MLLSACCFVGMLKTTNAYASCLHNKLKGSGSLKALLSSLKIVTHWSFNATDH